MNSTPPSAAKGCTAPAMGAQVRTRLGHRLGPTLRAHVDLCLPCRLEQLAYARFADFDAITQQTET